MKTQIRPTIKAHLLRSAFYLLLLLAVCAIPFALAQSRSRGTAKRSVATPVAKANVVAKTEDVPRATGPVTLPNAASGIVVPSTTGCIVVNGDFETGSLPPWTDTGDTSFTGVGPPAIPHSGNFALFSGPSTSDGFIDQTLPTVAGQAYDVTFWLQNVDTSGNNRFGASFGSVTLVPEAVQSTFGYTLFTFTNVVPGANADLHFIFYNPPSYFYLDDVCVTPSGGGTPTPTPTPTPTGSPTGCQFHVLIAYADIGGPPTTLQNEILAEPGVTGVDLFDAFSGTPTLQQLQQYNIVYAFSNNGWFDATAMGNVLADYQDAGGIVVVSTFAWDNRGPWLLAGRWITDGYSPYNSTSQTNFTSNTANITQPGHPLMQGVSSLTSFFRDGVTLTGGAASVAVWTDGPPAVSYQTHTGTTAVGINAYLGSNPQNFSGDWGRVIVNAGRWLLNCQGVSPTPTSTPTATPTGSPSCTPSGAKIYNIAGFGLGIQTNTTRIYDIAANSWTTGAPLPEGNGLSDHATAYWNGKIYVAGGYNGAATNALHIYDIASNSWTSGASLPQALFLPGFGAINGKVYVASGNNGSVEVNTLYIYDIATNSWTTGANVPTPVTGPGSAVYQGKLYLFGGAAPFPTLITTTQIYDPVANSWTTGPSLNMARLWFYGGNIDDTSIVAPGGDNPVGIPINVNEQLTASWAIRAPLPYAARGPFAVSDGTYVYIGGGYDGSSVHTDTLRYDPVANTYTPLAPAPDAHYLSQAVLVPGASCGTPTPTPTATFTPTPTATATFTPTPTATFTPTPTPTPTPLAHITLHARGYKVHGLQTVDLFWSGLSSGAVDIYRNGTLIITVPAQSGFYTDHINRNGRGTYTYRVCETGNGNCSNQVTVTFGSG